MTPKTVIASADRPRTLVPVTMLLALALVAALWASAHFSAEARMRRATARIVRLAEKQAGESPVALGLNANRLGGFLAAEAVLAVEEWGTLASGRQEIVQLFVQTHKSLETISFAGPKIAVFAPRKGEVMARVSARYRLADGAGEAAEGDGRAELRWVKGPDGWRIVQATLRPDLRDSRRQP